MCVDLCCRDWDVNRVGWRGTGIGIGDRYGCVMILVVGPRSG